MKALSVSALAKAVGGKIIYGDGDKQITSVSTNSKEIKEGALFVPIVGERVDAHKFISMALEAGAVATFTAKEVEEFKAEKVYIQVSDTLEALQSAAAYYRSLFSFTLIGITGSVGKTTTKEMIAAALETKKKVVKTKGNMNSQVGLPLMMFEIEEDTEVAVIEMGMSEVGEMSRLASIAKPDIAVLTNIGVSHIGQLGSKENIRKEKMNIINQFNGNNLVFVNGNDILLQEIKTFSHDCRNGNLVSTPLFDEDTREKLGEIQVLEYGMQANCGYRGENIINEGSHTHFQYISEQYKEDITLSVLGNHNVNNAVVALAIGEYFGIPPMEAKKGLEKYQPIEKRGQITNHKGIVIVDDTYNASPDSMKSGIDMLLSMPDIQRRIAVLADVLELGDVSRECHYEVGTYIGKGNQDGKKLDILVSVGTQAKAICEGAEAITKDICTKYFTEKGQAIIYLKEMASKGDGILVKGSRGMHMEDVVTALQSM